MTGQTTEVTLARALKLKNRVVGRMNEVNADLARYNSVQEGMEQGDVVAIYARRQDLMAQLVALKTQINAANAPIQGFIYELAECKSLMAVLRSLDTQHGRKLEGYASKEVNYVAVLRKPDVDREVRRLEARADWLQEQLDTFNHATRLSVDARLLDDGSASAG